MNVIFFKFGFTPYKAEQPLRGMEFQEKEVQNDENIGKLRKNLPIKGVCYF